MKNQKLSYKWPLIGNKHITEFFDRALSSEHVNGTYIFSGPDNLGKTRLALQLAQILLCQKYPSKNDELPCCSCPACKRLTIEENPEKEQTEIDPAHGDLHLLKKDKDKKNISVEQVREFIRALSMSSFLNSYKVGIIKNAGSLSSEGANALLKTLEEPKNKVVIILITENIENLLPTIVSRSKVLNFNLVKSDFIYDFLLKSHSASRSQAMNYSRLSLGRPALALKFLENNEFFRKYEIKLKAITGFMNQNVNERLKAMESVLNKELAGQELVRTATRTLEVWQGVLRDIILLHYGHDDFIQHHLSINELKDMEKRLSLNEIINLQKKIRQGRDYINANVNPRAVLEDIAINFI